MAKSETERFDAFVDRTTTPEGCWMWTGTLSGCWKAGVGHGSFRLTRPKRYVAAHRYAWARENGAIPSGMVVRHRCDNPRCVRVSHLELGTQADNVADMWARGRARTPRGSQQGRAKLHEVDVVEIRRAIWNGERKSDIARRYGVSDVTIGFIARGKTWRHVAVEKAAG